MRDSQSLDPLFRFLSLKNLYSTENLPTRLIAVVDHNWSHPIVVYQISRANELFIAAKMGEGYFLVID